jgi:hypothetical protein
MPAAVAEPNRTRPPRIDPFRLAPVREFRARPIGHHSAELTAMLAILRAGDVRGKYCLVCIRPHAEWMIARLSGVRGIAPVVEDNRAFHSIEEAEWEVFKLRWAQECGAALDEDAL